MTVTRWIQTSRLRLRPCEVSDVDDLHALWTDPLVRRHLWDDETISRERAAAEVGESLESFARHGFGQWAIFAEGNAPLIGFAGFRVVPDAGEVELLYGLAPRCWGQGLAREAVRVLLRHGFAMNRFVRVVATTEAANVASDRVLERVGMTLERCVRHGGRERLYYAISRDLVP